jgi:transposase
LVDITIDLDTRVKQAAQQLRWFKKQLFGQKSECRTDLEPDPLQLNRGEQHEQAKAFEEASTPVRGHARRKQVESKDNEASGLRFDDTVPIVRIDVPNPDLVGVADSDQILITERITHRLAQQPASYTIIEIVRQVNKRRDTGDITCPPSPATVLEKSYADVSLLAGMLVDKFRYHLPLYRQHQRMKAAGITVSRASLTNWTHSAIALLEPIYTAQQASVLESRVLAMDETPIRAGRKSKGKMRTAYYWPMYGDRDEVVFPHAASRANPAPDPDGAEKLALLLDRTRCGACWPDPELNLDVRSSRHRSLRLSRRCLAADRNSSPVEG